MLHCTVHRNEPRCFFPSASILNAFCSYTAFKARFYAVPNVPAPSATDTTVVRNVKCAISLCERQFHTVKELTPHLKEHLAEG